MTTSILQFPSVRVHSIVEYIKSSNSFLCDAGELEERGVQDILQEDFDIYEALSIEELSTIEDEFLAMAIENEIREASYLFRRLHPDDEGADLLHSSPKNDFGSRSIYIAEYCYPVDENLRKLPKISYPLKPATQLETRRLSALNKLYKEQVKGSHMARENTGQPVPKKL